MPPSPRLHAGRWGLPTQLNRKSRGVDTLQAFFLGLIVACLPGFIIVVCLLIFWRRGSDDADQSDRGEYRED